MSEPLKSGATAPEAVHVGRAARLDRVLSDLLGQVPELEAAAVVSFDGLALASALPAGMDEDRVAAMSAALLSLGERAAAGLGRGDLSQVYVEGEHGTVFLVSAQDEAVLVAVAAAAAKTGLVLFEIRHAAAAVATVLQEDLIEAPAAIVAEPPSWDSARLVVAAEPEPEPADVPEAPVSAYPPPLPPTPPPPPAAWPPAGYGQPSAAAGPQASAVVLPGSASATAAGLAAGFAGGPSPVSWSPAPAEELPPDPWSR